jgi:cupin fold WbuC family metalloprotein
MKKNIDLVNLNIFPELIEKAKKSDRKRAMYCLHSSNESMLHSMINVILKNSYICPHKHWVED